MLNKGLNGGTFTVARLFGGMDRAPLDSGASSVMPEALKLPTDTEKSFCQTNQESIHAPAVAYSKCSTNYYNTYNTKLAAAQKSLASAKSFSAANAAQAKIRAIKESESSGHTKACGKLEAAAYSARKKANAENIQWLLSRPSFTPQLDVIQYLLDVKQAGEIR